MSDLGVLYEQIGNLAHQILQATGRVPPLDAIYPQAITVSYQRVDPDGRVIPCAYRLPLRAERTR